MIDDSFLQPPAGTSAATTSPAGSSRSRCSPRARGLSTGACRMPRGARAGCWRVRDRRGGDRGRLLHHRRAFRRRLHRAARRFPAGLLLARRRAVTLWRSRRPTAPAPAVPPPRAARRRPAVVSRELVSSRSRSPTRPPTSSGPIVPEANSARSRGRALHDERRAGAPRLVHPVEQRRRRDRLPGSQRPPGHARMLARHGYGVLLFDRRGEGRARATATCSAGAATRTSSPRSTG